ncbi:hypothetical protein HAX54_051847, partial [Datura stramonium]|nr:hypothetical protein [Datura stramonium]
MLRVKAFSSYLVFCDFRVSLDDTQLGMRSSEGSPRFLTQNGDFGMFNADSERKSLAELIDIVASACCSV